MYKVFLDDNRIPHIGWIDVDESITIGELIDKYNIPTDCGKLYIDGWRISDAPFDDVRNKTILGAISLVASKFNLDYSSDRQFIINFYAECCVINGTTYFVGKD